MNPSDENDMLAMLHSIDATLKELLALSKSKRAGTAAAPVINDADLDSQYGDEPVKFKPRNWTGDFIKGTPMSACPPEMLDQLAETHDWFAKKNTDVGDEKKASYERRSAARARGWAARLRSGWKPKAVEGMLSADEVKW